MCVQVTPWKLATPSGTFLKKAELLHMYRLLLKTYPCDGFLASKEDIYQPANGSPESSLCPGLNPSGKNNHKTDTLMSHYQKHPIAGTLSRNAIHEEKTVIKYTASPPFSTKIIH